MAGCRPLFPSRSPVSHRFIHRCTPLRRAFPPYSYPKTLGDFGLGKEPTVWKLNLERTRLSFTVESLSSFLAHSRLSVFTYTKISLTWQTLGTGPRASAPRGAHIQVSPIFVADFVQGYRVRYEDAHITSICGEPCPRLLFASGVCGRVAGNFSPQPQYCFRPPAR